MLGAQLGERIYLGVLGEGRLGCKTWAPDGLQDWRVLGNSPGLSGPPYYPYLSHQLQKSLLSCPIESFWDIQGHVR